MDGNRTAAVFESLQLGSFSADWIRTCWDDDFVDVNSLPVESEQVLLEANYLIDQLRSVQEVLALWLESNNQNENGEGFWSILVENEISHKPLVAVLAYLVNNASKVSVDFTQRAVGVLSASIYLKLMALPGSAAFKIYHPELFLQACQLLNKWNMGGGNGKGKRKRSSSPIKLSQKSQGGKRKRQRRRSEESSTGNMNDTDENDEDDVVDKLSTKEQQELDELMRDLLQDVLYICENFSLRQSESTAIQLLNVMIRLTRMNPEAITEEMGKWKSDRCSPGVLAYKAVFLLCQSFHGHVSAMANEACKHFLYHILMLDDGKQFTNLGQNATLMRRHALCFVKYLFADLGERCIQSAKTLIQHICFKVPDKSDYRAQAALAVCELLDGLPDIEYARILEWLKRLSKHNKVGQRSFVIDVMLNLLEKEERKLSGDVPQELREFATHKSMVCTMLSRCSDSNASVRSRALVGFSSCTNSKHSDILTTIKDVITPVGVSSRPKAKHFMPTPQVALRPDAVDKSGKDLSERVETGPSNKQPEDTDPDNEQAGENSSMDQEHSQRDREDEVTDAQRKNIDTPKGSTNKSFCNIELTPGFNPYLPDTEGVVSMFRRRTLDMKVVVRKSALQALQNVIHFEAPDYRTEDLTTLQERCADPALSVRKQAVQSLFELLQAFPSDQKIQRAWVFGVLPQVMDRETSVQEKCYDLLEEMILLNLKSFDRTDEPNTAWDLLNIIADETCEKLRRYLQKACQYWARTKKLKPAVIDALQSHCGGLNDNASWMFLAEITKTPVKIKHNLVVAHWKGLTQTVYDDAACTKWTNVLSVLGGSVKHLPVDTVSYLLDDLKNKLRQFSYPAPLIAGMVNCISKLHGCLDLDTSQRQMQAWGEELMSECDRYMSDVILSSQNNSEMQINEDKLILYMFTLGEVCQRCPTRMPKRAALLIQSIIAAPCIGIIGNSGDHGTNTLHSEDNGENHAEYQEATHDSQGSQPRKDSESCGSQQSQTDSQNSHSPEKMSSQASQPLSQFRGSNLSNKLRAHAFITLGKLCLVDESLAKKTIAAMARELEESDSPAVRNNVVIVMGDLTIRYTTLVDRYITNIAACLKDPAALVRKNTLTILTRLLQEEYIKWKGVLFFRYITTLLDDAPEIKSLAEFCLEHLLLQKHPNMFFHPFVECIFYFNSYQDHTTYNKFKQTEREKQKFTLSGKENSSRRLHLYSFMLEHMTDEQKFKTSAKICKEILAAIADNMIPLDSESSYLLQDALAILSSKEIKLSTFRGKGPEETGEEGADIAQIVTTTAKKVLITQVVKRNVIENIVPVVISLKHMLEKNRSPLLKDLMGYLRELMKDYKTEVKDILAADKQLAEEIEFDIRNYENQQTEREALAQAAAAISSCAASPLIHQQSSKQSSRAGSPVCVLKNVLQETPGDGNIPSDTEPARPRRQSLVNVPSPRRSPVTIAEAAKKAMSRVDQLRKSSNYKSPRKVTSPATSRKSSVPDRADDLSQKQSEFQECDRENEENTVMSPSARNDLVRAISTPTDGSYNITFGADVNVTMLPPSPIPSVASAKNGGRLCLSPTLRVQRKGDKEIIHMPHPEAKQSEPVKWNIQSPAPKRSVDSSVKNDVNSTPSRKAHTASRAGLRRSDRHRRK